VYNFTYATYDAAALTNLAIESFQNGDYLEALGESAMAAAYAAEAIGWWYSTKIEWVGPTYMWSLKQHADMHEPDVWNELAGPCAVN